MPIAPPPQLQDTTAAGAAWPFRSPDGILSSTDRIGKRYPTLATASSWMYIVPSPESSNPRRYTRFAVRVSIAIHVLFVAAAISESGPSPGPRGTAQRTTIEVSHTEPEPESPAVRIVTDPDELTAEMVADPLDAKVAEARNRTADENLRQLEHYASRLESLTSDESLDSMSRVLSTNERATEPSDDPVAGPFDWETAQIHDVRREEAGGGWRYIATMLDGDGRTTDAELPANAGETAWKTMQTLKRFPFADKVYRRYAMPVIEKTMKALAEMRPLAEENGRDNR